MRWVLTTAGLALLASGQSACSEEVVETGEADTDTDVDTDTDTDEVEIAYDDGFAEELLVPETEALHAQVAVRFTAESYPVDLLVVRYWIGNEGSPNTEFAVQLYAPDGADGKPGTPLLAETVMTHCVFPGGNHWADADLTSLALVMNEDFYVAMDWSTPAGYEGEDAQWLGADHDEPDGRTWWKWNESSKWVPMETIFPAVDRDAMIRAIVRY
ncbi:MAG: hypothetical protein JXB39_00735 [Deltaproteobacteria bacterium]|nr:hypothetical protein [Deltaproteobacteria bacterium]